MSDTPKVTHMAFERRYADDSGVEFAVRLSPSGIEFEHVDSVEFPPEELDWLIACLTEIASVARNRRTPPSSEVAAGVPEGAQGQQQGRQGEKAQ